MGAPEEPRAGAKASRSFTLAVTNVTKLGGLVVAINELLVRSQLRPLSLAIAAVMMSGAQALESIVLKIIDRVLGGQ